MMIFAVPLRIIGDRMPLDLFMWKVLKSKETNTIIKLKYCDFWAGDSDVSGLFSYLGKFRFFWNDRESKADKLLGLYEILMYEFEEILQMRNDKNWKIK